MIKIIMSKLKVDGTCTFTMFIKDYENKVNKYVPN